MAADADVPTPNPEAEVSSRRRGIGLCLSGGGFRATLFHAGVIQRLFELGIATRTDGRSTVRDAAAIGRPEAPSEMRALGFETVASVSGGSITAAQWAVAEAQLRANSGGAGLLRPGTNGVGPAEKPVRERPISSDFLVSPKCHGRRPCWARNDGWADGGEPAIDFVRDVVRRLLALTRRDIRTGAMASKYLLPWNWFRGGFVVNNMVEKFEGAFGKGTLDLLPERPRFVFCGTDMAFGANFVFERERVGSYLAGYADPQGFTLGQAVAASACLPPLFGPMRIERAAERFKGGARRPDAHRHSASRK